MAALTTIAVTARTPKSATITFNAAAIDMNGTQIAQLASVLQKLATECQASMPTDTSAVVTGI